MSDGETKYVELKVLVSLALHYVTFRVMIAF